MTNHSRKTVSHTLIYALGQVIRNLVGLIMLPIYTRYLNRSDYGTIELLTMIIDLVGILLCNRIGEAVFRFYGTAENEGQKKSIIATSLVVAVFVNSIGYLLIYLLSSRFSSLAFGTESYAPLIAVFSLCLLTQAFVELPLLYIRAQQKPWLFLGLNLFKLAVQISCNVYFVVIRELHVVGVVCAGLLSGAIMALVLGLYAFSLASLKDFSLSLAKQIMKFTYPIALATLGSFYLTFGDRYFLRVFAGLDEVGLYALSYKIGYLLYPIAWEPFANIWDSQRYEIAKQPDASKTFSKYFLYHSLFLVFMALCASLFVKDTLRIISSHEFWSAYKVVPIVVIAYVIIIWGNFCNFGILYRQKTKHFTFAEIIAVAVITIGYLTLIPRYGAAGAAWASVAGFSARFCWIYCVSQKLYPMPLPWAKTLSASALAILLFALSWFCPEPMIGSIATRIALAFSYLVIIYYSPILGSEGRTQTQLAFGKTKNRIFRNEQIN